MKVGTDAPSRILVVDDNRAIHDDFRKILKPEDAAAAELRAAEAALFGDAPPECRPIELEITSAFQGQEAITAVETALREGRRFAMAFMDVRMPPGLDGIETTARLWKLDPDLQIVLCTAFSDYSWNDVRAQLGDTDNLVILKKPFDNIEVLQLSQALTEKWRLRQQARVKMADLEQMVRVRTADLEKANEQLRAEIAERKRAEQALRESQELLFRQERLAAVGQLSAGVAHDFNNIMTVIQGHANLLTMSERLSGSVAESVREIEAAATRAANLTRQLLAFSRKHVMRTSLLEPGAVVQNVAAMLGRTLGGMVTLHVELGASVPHIVADLGLIEQVLVNLVVNARDAMPKGGSVLIQVAGVELTGADVTSRPDARVGTFVRISVRDTGCGMSKETLSHLFEPFFTTKEVGKGTGLGLATAYGIVKQHRGWIEVESELGRGSTFNVLLPAAAADTVDTPSRAENRPASTGATTAPGQEEPAGRATLHDALQPSR